MRAEALQYKAVEKRIWEHNPLKGNDTSDFDGKVFYTNREKLLSVIYGQSGRQWRIPEPEKI